jgi:uncharacterized protein YhaN
MFLVELVMQGVRGFRELARLRFQGGFNFVAAGNEAGKTTAVDAMQRLLFPDSKTGTMERLISRHTPDASRAALVLFSDDGAYYRIIQDFSKGAVNLSQYNAASKDFSLLHKDWGSATQFMSGMTAGLSEEDYGRIFVFRREQYADPRGTSVPAPSPMPLARPAAPTPLKMGKTAATEAKLAELREMLAKAEEAADAAYRAQSAKLALEDIRKKLTVLEEIEQKKSELESALAELKACGTLPENLPDLVDAYERLQGQKMADADGLNKELETLRMQLADIPTTSLITDKLFIFGAALGILSFAAGMFVLKGEQAVFFPIGVLLAVGLIAAAGYNGSRKSAQRRAVAKEMEGLEKELKDLEKSFEREGEAITSCMRVTGAATPGELKDKADNYRYFLSLRDDIIEQEQRALGGRTSEMLQQEYNQQQQQALELERAAQAVSKDNVDTYAIRQDIDRLEGGPAPGASWDFGAEVPELPTDFTAPAARENRTGFQAELEIASRIGEIEMETLVPAVEAAAQRNIFAVTEGRYVRIEAGQDGGPPVVQAGDDSRVGFAELSHGTRDLVYFCLRAGLVEALAGKRRLPFILDDPFAGLDAARQKAACQVLRALGTKTQVILFSSNPALKAEGDAVAEFS